MTSRSEIEQTLDRYLAEGPERVPDRVIDAALDQIEHTEQRRVLRVLRRAFHMPTFTKLAAAGTAVIVVVLVGGVFLNRGSSPPGGVPTSPSPSSGAVPSSTSTPSRSPAPSGPTGCDAPVGRIAAGPLNVSTVSPTPILELGAGWWAGWDLGDPVCASTGYLALEHQLSAGGFVRLAFWDLTELPIHDLTSGAEQPAPRDVASYLENSTRVTRVTSQDTEVGGMTARRLSFDWLGSNVMFVESPAGGPAQFLFDPGERQNWIVIDEPDGQIAINWTIEDESSATPSQAEADQLVEAVLATIEFEP